MQQSFKNASTTNADEEDLLAELFPQPSDFENFNQGAELITQLIADPTKLNDLPPDMLQIIADMGQASEEIDRFLDECAVMNASRDAAGCSPVFH
ncbi:MAG: hypothetical protein GC136_10445 [Alphaproteobacteria bacterium]|nr:hypothetical protein [Alphaproteobacteria bacterium]